MTNLLAQAIDCDDPNQAARIIRDALGIEGDDVVNYCFPDDLAGRSRAARPIYWRVAQDRSPLSRVVTEPRRFPPPGPSRRRPALSCRLGVERLGVRAGLKIKTHTPFCKHPGS